MRTWQKDRLLQIANALTRARVGAGNLWASPGDIVPRKELLHLRIGIPDSEALPRDQLNQAMQEVMAGEDDTSLRYGFGRGYSPIREYLAGKYTRERSLEVDEEWFQLTNGSTAAIDLIVRSIIDPGDVIVTETPTYMGSLANFLGVGADICPISVDESGLRIDELTGKITALKKEGKRVKLLYTISSFQNPTGTTMSVDRKRELLQIADREEFLILDDDAYGDLYYDSPPSAAMSGLGGGHGVMTVGSFSKTVATGLRIGWIHAHPDALDLFSRMKFDMGQNQMAQHMMGRFLEKGHLEPHLENVRRLYKKKMTFVADAMETHLSDYVSFVRPTGGFYLWVRLRHGLSANAVWRTATQEGVSVNPGTNFIPSYSEDKGQYLRIAYCSTPMDQLEEAIHRLVLAIRRVANGDSA